LGAEEYRRLCWLRAAGRKPQGEFAMTYFDMQQQGPQQQGPQQQGPMFNYNPQQAGPLNPQLFQLHGGWPGAAALHGAYPAFGQQYGQYGAQPGIGGLFGQNPGWGAQPQWWGQQQRQLSQQDVSEVVRQLLPALPQVVAQAQQPYPGPGYAAYGPTPRTLSQQDINDVVRQLLPVLPQIVGALQGPPQLQHLAMHGGGIGALGQGYLGFNPAQNPFAMQNPLASLQQPWFGQYGAPQFQSAFGVPQQAGQQWAQQPWSQQRQLTQQDVADVTRQLVGLIPQVISNLQAFNQQRMN
jgi:hypothetical protein